MTKKIKTPKKHDWVAKVSNFLPKQQPKYTVLVTYQRTSRMSYKFSFTDEGTEIETHINPRKTARENVEELISQRAILFTSVEQANQVIEHLKQDKDICHIVIDSNHLHHRMFKK